MKIQDPKKEFAPFDVAPGLAQALLAQGYTEIKPVVPVKPPVELKWTVSQGPQEGDYQFPPRLFHSCSTCGVRGVTESTQGTAHLSAKIFHCGQRGVVCPADVAAQYVKAFAAWKARSRKPVEKISPVSPAHHVRAFGLKSRQELITNALTEVRNGQ
jgi:hypothetical protein